MVFCSIHYKCRILDGFSSFPQKVQTLLRSVTKGQRRKFNKFGIVPLPVLEALWHMGFLPTDGAPERGMKVLILTEYLSQGKYRTEQAADRGQWLYTQIIKEEVIGCGVPLQKGQRKKRPLLCEYCTFYDVSVSPASNFEAKCKYRGGIFCLRKDS
jgi:hypothetical protein